MLLMMTAIPMAAAVIGAALAIRWAPGELFAAAVQHLAAGVVFATAASELLPDILHSALPVSTIIGGFGGIAVMLAIRNLETLVRGPVGMLTGIGVDILVDGLVLGIGFAVDLRTGILLTVALTLELLLLGLTSVTALREVFPRPAMRLIGVAVLAMMLPLGVLLAAPVALLPEQANLGVLTFGLVALLFLVTEELLVEAHEVEEKSWVTALFFVGFLGLLLLDEMMR
ncbi:MAG TPA: transporter [Albidovulum sp.]|uniref:hypothetical protein n=1 Tax=Albidovulum sp. TaxID=1872424 RepID=UPI002CA90007|nr:transporter [Albidovulum sp.]